MHVASPLQQYVIRSGVPRCDVVFVNVPTPDNAPTLDATRAADNFANFRQTGIYLSRNNSSTLSTDNSKPEREKKPPIRGRVTGDDSITTSHVKINIYVNGGRQGRRHVDLQTHHHPSVAQPHQ